MMTTYDQLKTRIELCGVHAQLGPAGEGWGIEQNPHELATFMVRMQELGVQSVLEIGTGYKAGLARFLAQETGWRVTSVDIRDYGHSYDGIHFLVLPEKPIGYFDLVFIDGAHDYASVKADYETYSPMALKVVAFHDIAGLRACEGAQKFWQDIYDLGMVVYKNQYGFKLFYRCYEVINQSPYMAGIGWLEIEHDAPGRA